MMLTQISGQRSSVRRLSRDGLDGLHLCHGRCQRRESALRLPLLVSLSCPTPPHLSAALTAYQRWSIRGRPLSGRHVRLLELLQASRARPTKHPDSSLHLRRASLLGFLDGGGVFRLERSQRSPGMAVDVYVRALRRYGRARADKSSICGVVSAPCAIWTAFAMPQLPARAKANW